MAKICDSEILYKAKDITKENLVPRVSGLPSKMVIWKAMPERSGNKETAVRDVASYSSIVNFTRFDFFDFFIKDIRMAPYFSIFV